jgi:hypothetical protein
LISNFSPTLKNISDPWDFIIGVVVATPLILMIVKLKAYDEPEEVDYEFESLKILSVLKLDKSISSLL